MEGGGGERAPKKKLFRRAGITPPGGGKMYSHYIKVVKDNKMKEKSLYTHHIFTREK